MLSFLRLMMDQGEIRARQAEQAHAAAFHAHVATHARKERASIWYSDSVVGWRMGKPVIKGKTNVPAVRRDQ